MNVIAQLEYELAYYDSAVHCFNHYTTRILVDSRYSQTLVSRTVCHQWRQEEVGVLTADRRTLNCCGYGKIKLGFEQARPVIVEVLVVDGLMLGFDLLLEIDAIKVLNGVHLTESGKARFGNPNRCAPISIDKPNISVTFDRSTKAWTALWKWTSDHSHKVLANRVQKYTVFDHVRDVYEEELSMWRFNRNKRPHPRYHLWDLDIREECRRCDGQELDSNNKDSNGLSYRHHKRACLWCVEL